MLRENVGDLAAFLAVARTGSFTRAAKQLGVSQPALSHAMKELERRLGLRLLNRTTRSVATTEAGERLRRRIAPHFDGIEAGLTELTELREKPSGTIRITTSKHAAMSALWPRLAKLLPDYPDVHVELSLDAGFADVVSDRFDAGVRLGEAVAKDMVAVRIGPDLRMAVVGSPAYFERYPVPRSPQDLAAHRCINQRRVTSGGLYAWELERDGREVRVRVEGQLAFNDDDIILRAALDGFGLAFVMEDLAASEIATGRLRRVLEEWCEPFAGYHLYYPSRLQPSAAFTLVVDALRHRS
ncbi:LysR family transcriptional regulator [Methylorubrum populi]|uniref:LysR family transcriptional regulator n=1 Tax=Methylorubrum populi TaxID=223967 RepID=A0A169QF80_9HYPH|nr:LysR family transcriptional regulator [Methylorubrum populi]BAU88804.1 LysR family transcriptional regulator [Methylorubrum populi]